LGGPVLFEMEFNLGPGSGRRMARPAGAKLFHRGIGAPRSQKSPTSRGWSQSEDKSSARNPSNREGSPPNDKSAKSEGEVARKHHQIPLKESEDVLCLKTEGWPHAPGSSQTEGGGGFIKT